MVRSVWIKSNTQESWEKKGKGKKQVTEKALKISTLDSTFTRNTEQKGEQEKYVENQF